MTLVEGIHYQDFKKKIRLSHYIHMRIEKVLELWQLGPVILQRSASENWTEVISNLARITCVAAGGVSRISRPELAL